MKQDRQTSIELLAKSRESFRNLNYIDSYHQVMESVEADPSNIKSYYQIKSLLSTIAFSYPEFFDSNQVLSVLGQSLQINSRSSILWNIKGLLHKITGEWEKSEEAYFRSVLFCDGTEFINSYYLFELGYLYKNTGNTEIFNQTAFSAPWQLYLVRKTGRLAIPMELLEKRIAKIDLKLPPIKYIKQFEQNPGRLNLLQIEKNFDVNELARFIGALEKRGAQFVFFHNISKENQTALIQIMGKDTGYFHKFHQTCPASIFIEKNRVIVCPLMAEETGKILERVDKMWEISIQKHSFCSCRNRTSNF